MAEAVKRARFTSASVPTPRSGKKQRINTVFYVGGPVSVLNAACTDHANVRLDYYNRLALTMKVMVDIPAGEELYIIYDTKPLNSMGFMSQCPKCSRLVTDV